MRRILLVFGIMALWLGVNAQLTAPFTESFNTTSIPTGWSNTSTNTGTNANWKFSGTPGNPSMSGTAYNPPVILDHTGNSGSIAWVDGSTPVVADCGLLTDSIDISALSSLYVQFWFYSNNITNPGDNNTIYVNFYDGTQWNDSIWGYAGDGPVWQFVGIDLSSYTTSGKILFEIVVDQLTATTAFYNDILLDDFSVMNVPPCPFPLGLSASNVTATTADLSWTSVTAASSYEVIYGVEGFNPATGGSSATSTTANVTLSTLAGATTYDAYLIADCATNGTSDTAGPVKFTTLCVPFTAPYANNFDSETDGQVALCWEQYNSYSTTAYARVENLGTPRSGTQQLAMYSASGYTANDTLVAITPQLSDLTVGDKQIRFHAKTSSTNDTLYVLSLSSNTPSATFTIIDTIAFSSTNTYQEVILPISAANGYNGTDQYLGFAMGLNGASTFSYIYVDDFFYEVVPTCPKISNIQLAGISSTGASFGFTTTGTAVQYELGPAGFTQGTNTAAIQSATGNPISVSGLAPGTAYDIYIRNDCGGGDTSVWEGPYTFTTAFVPPYLQDFASGIPSSWGNLRGSIANPTVFTGNGSWGNDGFGNVGTTGAARHNIYSTFPADWLMGPSVDLGNGSVDYQMEFDAALTAYFTTNSATLGVDDTVKVVLSYDGGVTWNDSNTIFSLSSADNISNTGTHYIVSLAGITGTVKFAFYAESTVSNADNDFFVDNIEIVEVPSCPQPLMLSANAFGTDSLFATWNAGSATTLKSFIEYGPVGFAPQSGSASGMVAVTDTFVGIGGLLPNTAYDVYVYDSCAVGFSPASGPVMIQTDCLPAIMPLTESFDVWPIACWENTGSFGWNEFNGPSGDNYAEADFWGNSSGEAIFNTQSVILTQYAQVSFDWSHLYSASYPDDQLIVMIKKVSSTTWDTLLDLQGPNNFNDGSAGNSNTPGNFIHEEIILDTNDYGLNDTVHVRLQANTDFGPDLFINNFAIEPLPACPTPFNLTATNLTATSADINATSYFASSFNIEWGPSGFNQGSGTGNLITNIGSLPYNLTGLSPNTFYDVYIQVNCGGGQTVWVGPITFKTPCLAALAGTYTIGGPAGATNFATLDSALTVLNGCGVSAPVVFNMAGGTFYPNNSISEITGASATNTITFNGNSVNPDTIGGMVLEGADYITFNNVYFRNTSGFVVRLTNQADNNTFDGCTFEASTTSTSAATAGLVATGSATSASTTGNNANNLTVNNCTVIGGYYGLSIYGSGTSNHGNTVAFTNNTFRDQYYYGARVYYMDNVTVSGNDMSQGFRNTTSYGMYIYYDDYVDVNTNVVYDATYGLYAYGTGLLDGNGTANYVNNMLEGSTYALYFSTMKNTGVYHNTCVGGRGFYGIGTTDSVNFRNNVFGTNNTTGYSFYFGTTPTNSVIDYNAYDTTVSSNFAYYGTTAYTSLSAWQTAVPAMNASSLAGDIGLVGPNDFHGLGVLINDVGDNSVGVLVDIDGDVRPAAGSTVVDMGADEYTPVTEDIAIVSAAFDRNSLCLTNNDTIEVTIVNSIGSTKNFATNNLVINYDVTGPVNTSGSFTLNTGTLAFNNTLTVSISGIDMSVPGTYNLDANIAPNAVNLTAINDSLEGAATDRVGELFNAKPDTIVYVNSATDTVEIETRSPLFGGGGFHFTEIMHFQTPTGSPTGGWPSYITTSVDEYVEITGVPGADLGGYTFEQWNTSGTTPTGSIVLPPGTVIGPNGTALLTMRATAPTSPADYLYDGSGGNTVDWQSSGGQGVILKDASGVIVDAAAYPTSSGPYVFPAAANVTTADWGGGTPGAATTTCGVRLEGPDLNDATGWVLSSNSPQDPNVVNANVVVPAPLNVSGFDWMLGGASYSTTPDTIVTNFTASGTFYYVATYNSICGVLTDTVTIVVNLGCPTPSNFSATVNACDDVVLNWTGAGDSSIVAVVPAGGTPTSGTLVINDSTLNYTAGMANTSYDVYIANICGGDTAAPAGPFSFSIADEGVPTASFISSALGLTVNLDASGSTGAGLTYTWDFGDGNTGTGMNTTHTYAAGGAFTICLTVTNACGSDTTCTIEPNIGIAESPLSRSLAVFPNPTHSDVQVEFSTFGEKTASIRVMELSGREVINRTETLEGDAHKARLNLSNLATGVYTLEISSGSMKATRRLIKN
jgi:hypothetical protein